MNLSETLSTMFQTQVFIFYTEKGLDVVVVDGKKLDKIIKYLLDGGYEIHKACYNKEIEMDGVKTTDLICRILKS